MHSVLNKYNPNTFRYLTNLRNRSSDDAEELMRLVACEVMPF
jgi:hypothetical protein